MDHCETLFQWCLLRFLKFSKNLVVILIPVGFCSGITRWDPQHFGGTGKHQVRRGWTEMRTELPGTWGDEPAASLLTGNTVSQDRRMRTRMRIPPLYTFLLANGDEGVNRSEHTSALLKRFSKDKYRMGNPWVSCYILVSATRLTQMFP